MSWKPLNTSCSIHYNFKQLHTVRFRISLSLASGRESVSLMAAMTSKLKVYPFVFVLLSFVTFSWCENQEINDAVTNIFLKKQFNSTDSEWILKSARESYLYLKGVEKEADVNEKFNFVKNYGNFLLKLFKELQTKDVDIYQLFLKENSFLKEYNRNQTGNDFNITELKTKIEDLQTTAERHLTAYYNSSNMCYAASEVLSLNETSFDVFLREKIRAEFSEIGYFFLEVFATLIGLSWGIISTVMHYTESGGENVP